VIGIRYLVVLTCVPPCDTHDFNVLCSIYSMLLAFQKAYLTISARPKCWEDGVWKSEMTESGALPLWA
jgi:hypothetical protein